MTLMDKEAFKKGFQDGVPIALGYAAVSFALGIASISA
jgi:predicted branched-subunit amino acid permease